MKDLQSVYKEIFFHHEYSQGVVQIAQGINELSILGGFQDQTG